MSDLFCASLLIWWKPNCDNHVFKDISLHACSFSFPSSLGEHFLPGVPGSWKFMLQRVLGVKEEVPVSVCGLYSSFHSPPCAQHSPEIANYYLLYLRWWNLCFFWCDAGCYPQGEQGWWRGDWKYCRWRVYTADNGSERDSFFVNVWKSVNRGYSIPWVRRSVTLSFSSCFRQLVGSHFRASLASLRRNLCDNPLSLEQHGTSPCQTVI